MTIRVSQVTGSVVIVPDSSLTEAQVSAMFVEVLADAPPAGKLYLNGVALSEPVYNDTNVVAMHGDRSAFDVDLYPERHASDIENNERYHLPWPADPDMVAVSDGSKWVLMDINTIAL